MVANWSPPDSPQGPGGVIFARAMPTEPDIKRAVSFIDGQNLYRHAKDAFGHHHPNLRSSWARRCGVRRGIRVDVPHAVSTTIRPRTRCHDTL